MKKISTKINVLDSNKNKTSNQLILFLYSTFTKSDWMKELSNSNSNFYILVKEEVEEFFFRTKGFLNYLDFESTYSLSVEITVNQIRKSIIKQKKCFFEKKLNYIDIWNILKQRLLNNIKNLFDKKRKINLLNIEYLLLNDIYRNYENDLVIWDLQNIAKSNPNIIVEVIKDFLKSSELTTDEIIELGEKIDMNFSKLITSDLTISKKSVNNELFFITDNKVA